MTSRTSFACRTSFAWAGLLTATALGTASMAHAGGFALKERSTTGQGASFAGVTAGAAGLSSMGFNPAALGLVDEVELSGGGSIVAPQADGDVTVGGTSIGSVDPARDALVVNGYAGYRLQEDIIVGIASYTPFGLTTQYEVSDLPVSLDATTSKLLTLVIAPTIAYQPTPEFTVAGSINITRADARLVSVPATLDGNQTTVSFGLGALWNNASSGTKVGVAYQHGYDLTLKGSGNFSAGPLAGLTLPATAKASLPSTVSAGISQAFGDFRVLGEVQWQNWSVFDTIDVFAAGVGQIQADEQHYDDAFFVSLGGEYDFSDKIVLRAGVAFDQTPTSDAFLPGQTNTTTATDRTVRVPDEDRLWLSLGGSYDVNDHMTLDAGYSYLTGLDDVVVGVRNAAPGTNVTYDAGAHIFSVGGTIRFDAP